MVEPRPLERALELARGRLALLQAGEMAGLEAIDSALAAACEAARGDLSPADGPGVDELLAIHRAADELIAAELRETGARIRRLRAGQAGNAAYHLGGVDL
jgi:hypothetical protein